MVRLSLDFAEKDWCFGRFDVPDTLFSSLMVFESLHYDVYLVDSVLELS